MFWWLVAGILILVLTSLIPIGLGVSFHYEQGQGVLRVITVFAHLIHWRIVIPTRWIRLQRDGVWVTARTGFQPHPKGRGLTEKVTPQKLREEPKLMESQLHRLLAAVDLIQVLLFGHDPNDQRARSLGSPLLHLVGGSIIGFLGRICRVEFAWQTRLGTGDALTTALGTGLLWTVKSTFSTLLQQRYTLLKLPTMEVVPKFETVEFYTDIRCIFHLTLGQIMWRTVCDAAHRWQGKEAGSFGG